jgi:transcriptional regulator with XRE-family HTH domain
MEKDTLLVAVGGHIRALRKAKGFSQEGFAAAAGLDRAYYGGVERGERNLSLRNLVRIAAALEVEVGELFPPMTELSQSLTPS